jgi:hypothetical protein
MPVSQLPEAALAVDEALCVTVAATESVRRGVRACSQALANSTSAASSQYFERR